MTTLSACMISLNDADFIQLSLKSLLRFVDEVIIVDGGSKDGTLEKIDEIQDNRVKVIHSPWKGDYGAQRQIALKEATCDWVLQLDPDEVYCDSAGRIILQAISSHNELQVGCFHTKMEHFIRDFGHVDSTRDVHYCLNRLVRNNGRLYYAGRIHELLQGFDAPVENLDSKCVNYHLGYLRGLKTISEKWEKNVQEKAHTPEFLEWWKTSHLVGEYPVKAFDLKDLDSSIIREAFHL
jgi:glycosyltransferase involved in cell wall biosynthesis